MPHFGEMAIVSPQFIASLTVLALAGWFSLWLRRRRRRQKPPHRAGTVALFTVSIVLSISVAGSCVNSYFSYLPKVNDLLDLVLGGQPPELRQALAESATDRTAREATDGELVRLSVPDNGSGFGRSSAMVWLPPQYFQQPNNRFRVVYLFHGSPGVAKDWYRGGEAGRIGLQLSREGKPAILVAPRMSRDWLDDPECVDGVHQRIESHLLKDVIPAVDASLRSVTTRHGRIFAGMSAGGFCALNLGLRNRSVTSTILDLSGFTRPTHSGGLKALFGPSGSDAARQNTPAEYAGSLPRNPAMSLWLDSGSSDRRVLSDIAAIAPVLRSRGYTVVERVRPGAHTYSVWRPALHDALRWALAPRAAAGQP
jgi:enterochelin esterase-like enzyme